MIGSERDALHKDLLFRRLSGASESNLNRLLEVYQRYHKELQDIEDFINEKVNKQSNLWVNLSILYFVLHFLVFYYFIYHVYGWDEVEPVTYIVGNVYWIVGLLFFIKFRKSLKVHYFTSSTFKEKIFNTNAAKLRFCGVEKEFLMKEINTILALKTKI